MYALRQMKCRNTEMRGRFAKICHFNNVIPNTVLISQYFYLLHVNPDYLKKQFDHLRLESYTNV